MKGTDDAAESCVADAGYDDVPPFGDARWMRLRVRIPAIVITEIASS